MSVKMLGSGDDEGASPLENVTFEGTSLVIEEGKTYEEWEDIGKWLGRVSGAMQWWIGDWLNYGERKYGEMYTQAGEYTGYTPATLANIKWLSTTFPAEKRRAVLTFDHHAAVASLMGEHEDIAMEILDTAERDNLNSKETRADARQARVDLQLEKYSELPTFGGPSHDDLLDSAKFASSVVNGNGHNGASKVDVAWLDELLSIVMQVARSEEDSPELEEARRRAVAWAMEHELGDDHE